MKRKENGRDCFSFFSSSFAAFSEFWRGEFMRERKRERERKKKERERG
jgi:hypothetical protein